jgi:hypothetical protein
MSSSLSPSFKRRYGPSAQAVAARMTATYGHLAVAIATELYDERGDLLEHAAQFLIDLRKADIAYGESLTASHQMFGFGSPAYLATKRLAMNQRADDYQKALDKYDLANEAGDIDNIEDVPALLAAE